MIESFKDRATEDVFDGKNSKAARKVCPPSLWAVARRKLDQLNTVKSLDELTIPPGNRLEALKGDRRGQYSTINQPAVSNMLYLATRQSSLSRDCRLSLSKKNK